MTIKTMKNWRKLDPYYSREMEKYGHALPSREFILSVLEAQGALLSLAEIVRIFGLRGADVASLNHRLQAMVRQGQLAFDRKERFGISKKMDLWRGQIIAHAEGYGFFRPDDGSEDGFIAPKYMQEYMHGDSVLARLSHIDRQGHSEFVPVEILERGQKRIVGRVEREEGAYFLQAENRRLTQPLLLQDSPENKKYFQQLVIAEIIRYPTRRQGALLKILMPLAYDNEADAQVGIALENHQIPYEFSQATLRDLEKIPDKLRKKEYQDRLDLRHLPFVTIDGESSRDFDDAVFAKKRGENYALYVAIADVAHYVQKDSPLDEDAFSRGTSVYFPDRVIPMLPEKLSNGLCSLNPNVDRLALVCEMTITPEGEVKRARFHRAVIHSKARLTYETVEEILFHDNAIVGDVFPEVDASLQTLEVVYNILFAQRKKRCALEFELPEAEFIYDSEGRIEAVTTRKRLQAHRLIEECMIAANVCAAKYLEKHKIPALYRIHDAPSADRVSKLRDLLRRSGLDLGKIGQTLTPERISQLLEQVRLRSDGSLLEKMILRTMMQAIYSPENRGHFGLALTHYAHFTSPIRRYPDLMVHRAIHHRLSGGKRKDFPYTPMHMQEIAQHSSMTERRADEATRDVMDFLKCDFMRTHIGEQFSGVISNVTRFGLFITLDEFMISGLVHVSTLSNDYYHFDEASAQLIGERRGDVFSLMDKVCVQVARVDSKARKIDFILIAHEPTTSKRGGKKSPKKATKKAGKKAFQRESAQLKRKDKRKKRQDQDKRRGKRSDKRQQRRKKR